MYGEQACNRLTVQAADMELLKAPRLEFRSVAFASGKDQRHAFSLEAPRRKQQRLGRRSVEPLRIIDQAEQGRVLRHHRQETEECRVNGKAIARFRRPECKRAAQRR